MADFALYDPAPPAAVQAFETGPHGPNDQNVLDFGKGFEKSRWNKVILKKFVDNLLEERREDGSWDISDVSNQYLLALFYGQLKRSRESWRQVQNHPIIDEGRMETTAEVAERIDEYTIQRLAMVGSRSRRERVSLLNLNLNVPSLSISFRSMNAKPRLSRELYALNWLRMLRISRHGSTFAISSSSFPLTACHLKKRE